MTLVAAQGQAVLALAIGRRLKPRLTKAPALRGQKHLSVRTSCFVSRDFSRQAAPFGEWCFVSRDFSRQACLDDNSITVVAG